MKKINHRRLLWFLIIALLLYFYTRIVVWFTVSDLNRSHHHHQQQQQHLQHQQQQQVQENFVIISSTITETARAEDYAFLLPLSAVSWSNRGYTPLIAAVGTNSSAIDEIISLWSILLPDNSKIKPIIISNPERMITVAQVLRLYASNIWPELHNESFLRLTDADMLIMDHNAFLPIPDDSSVDITVFNGNGYPKPSSGCREYSMHSVGMKVGLWRELLPMKLDVSNKTFSESLEEFINTEVTKIIPDFAVTGKMVHGGHSWGADQWILGCTIDHARDAGYIVELADGPGVRVHVWDRQYILTEVHLAAFTLKEREDWLKRLINSTNVLRGYQELYPVYTNAWKKLHNLDG